VAGLGGEAFDFDWFELVVLGGALFEERNCFFHVDAFDVDLGRENEANVGLGRGDLDSPV